MDCALHDFPLTKFNSFGIAVKTKQYFSFSDEKQIIDIINVIKKEKLPVLVMGGGSNILFTDNFQGIVVHPLNKGIEIVEENTDSVLVKVAAGEVWDDFVAWAVRHNYYGVENLSHIPGNVGAAPIQNIGAYGVELSDSLTMIKSFEIGSGKIKVFSASDCNMGYRSSIFKYKLKGKYIISEVFFRLNKNGTLNTSYGTIENELLSFSEINLQNLRQAIINIRKKKLPDPLELGNAGSFFKNPVVTKSKADDLLKRFKNIPTYPAGENIKLAAGWLIDQCGWKGKRLGDAGVHKDQALVLVNYGNASGKDIVALSEKIKKSILAKFDVELETEVNIV